MTSRNQLSRIPQPVPPGVITALVKLHLADLLRSARQHIRPVAAVFELAALLGFALLPRIRLPDDQAGGGRPAWRLVGVKSRRRL